MSIMVGVGRGAQAGVLIKNAEALERMEKVDTLVVDKTGTLTEGKPKVVAIVAGARLRRERTCCGFAASVERASEHPLAAAIVAAAAERNIELARVLGFDSPAGKGAIGMVERRRVVLGNAKFLAELGIATARARRRGRAPARRTARPRSSSRSTARPPASSPSPTRSRRRRRRRSRRCAGDGVRIVMLTGDNRTTARGGRAPPRHRRGRGRSAARPARADVVEQLRRAGRVVAMAGDGVNDAPALAAADVGIAMGTGTDVAIESAGITLLKGDLTGIVRARALSAAIMRNIRQNLFFAFIYNAAGVPIAAGVLYPVFGMLLSPVIAAAAMALSSVSVVGNALRLRRVEL